MTNCGYAPCDYIEKAEGRIGKVEETVNKLEITTAVMQRDLKMLLGITSFIAVSIGAWIISNLLGLVA